MLLVVAWDGACFELLEGWIRGGELPVLAGLMEGGAYLRLRSTVPPVTFPAWTSFMTAASPARHGVTDFTVRPDGDYAVRFVNASYRRLPTVWRLMSRAGRRVGVYALPATYPAEPLSGLQVCGFDTPLGASERPGFCHPPELAAELSRTYGDLAIRGPSQGRIGTGWHGRALEEMRSSIRLRTRIVGDLIKRDAFDCFTVHYGESDTASHHFWQFHDPDSPYRVSDELDDALLDVYRELDAALGRLLEAAGSGCRVMLLSDHGSGGSSDRVIVWNRWLADLGWLTFEGGGAAAGRLFRGLRRVALRIVPSSLQSRLFGRLGGAAAALESRSRFAGIDWFQTRAFSEELNYHPSVWLNVRGREPRDLVEPARVPEVLAELTVQALALRDVWDGEPVVRRVWRREELADGPFASRIPDLVFELREPEGYSYGAVSSRGGGEPGAMRRLEPAEMTGAKGTSMSGSHRPFGMCVLSGPGIRSGRYGDAPIEDAGATLLAMSGLSPSETMDGRVWHDAVALGDLGAVESGGLIDPSPYSSEEEAELAERLRALGYLG